MWVHASIVGPAHKGSCVLNRHAPHRVGLCMEAIVAWLTFGAVQVLILAFAIGAVMRLGEAGGPYGWLVLVVLGVLLAGANLAWLATGGPMGTSPIGLRGGLLGAWLSMIVVIEVVLVALIALLRERPG